MAREVIEVPLTGKIISFECKLGETVKEGDTVCTIESMKMENPIIAPVSGKVTEIKAQVGQVVNSGSVLVVIEY